jgi:hypothetical protein
MNESPKTNEAVNASTTMDSGRHFQRSAGESQRPAVFAGQLATPSNDPNAEPANGDFGSDHATGLIGLETKRNPAIFRVEIYLDKDGNACVDYDKSPLLVGPHLELAEILYRVIDNTMKSLTKAVTADIEKALIHKPSQIGALMDQETMVHAPDLTDFLDKKFE